MNPSTETLGFRGFVNRAERDVDEDEDVHVGTEANLLGKLKEVVKVEDIGLSYDNDTEIRAQPLRQNIGMGSDVVSAYPDRKMNPAGNKWTLPSLSLFTKGLGTLPQTLEYSKRASFPVQFVDAVLRGVSQVMLINNPITGLLILIGIAVDSYYSFIYALLGVVASTGCAFYLGLDTTSVQAGLYGYNGILVGLAIQLFSFGSANNPNWQYLLPTFFMSTMSTFIFVAVGNVSVKLLSLAPFTFPFQITTWMWMLAAQTSFQRFPVETPVPMLNDVGMDSSVGSSFTSPVLFSQYTGLDFIKGVFAGLSQVFLVENSISGAVILAAVLLSSPFSGIMMIFGSCFAVAFSMVMGVAREDISAGLSSYNSVLTAVVVGLFFVPTWRLLVFNGVATIFTVVVGAAVSTVFVPVGLPALTFPFTLVSWIFILMARGNVIEGIKSIDLDMITTPENHLLRYQISQRVSRRLIAMLGRLGRTISYLNLNTEEDVLDLEKRVIPILLCSYAASGQLEHMKSLLADGESGNTPLNRSCDYDMRTPLMLAAAQSKAHIVKYLVEEVKVDVNARDRWGGCALEDAIRARSLFMVRYLVSRGAKLSKGSKHFSAGDSLLQAVKRKDSLLVLLLLEAGIPPNLHDKLTMTTPLHLACEAVGGLANVKCLISFGAEHDATDFTGSTALDLAKKRKDEEGSEILDLLRAETKSRSRLRSEVEAIATSQGQGGNSASAPPGAKNGSTHYESMLSDIDKVIPALLCSACERDATNEIMYLINSREAQGDGGNGDHDGFEAGHSDDSYHDGDSIDDGIVTENIKVRAETSDNAVEVNSVDYDGASGLAIACRNFSLNSARLLLQQGANPSVVDRWGFTPLLEIVVNYNVESKYPQERIRSTSSVSVTSTSVHSIEAMTLDFPPDALEIITLLLEYGGVLTLGLESHDIMRQHMWRLARHKDSSAWNHLRRIKGVDYNLLNHDGWTPLHVASYTSSAASVAFLLDIGANCKIRDRWGKLAQDYANEEVKQLFQMHNDKLPSAEEPV